MQLKKIISLLIFAFIACQAISQDRFIELEKRLTKMEEKNPGLLEEVDLSFSQVSIQEFIRAMAVSNSLNITVDPNLKFRVVNNFKNVTAKDVLLYLCKRYNLSIINTGSIISIVPFSSYKLRIDYNNANNTLTLDLKQDTLYSVVKKITQLSNKNVILAPGLGTEQVTGYIQNLPFHSALEKLAFSNQLELNITDDSSYIVSKKQIQNQATNTQGYNNQGGNRHNRNKKPQGSGGGMMDLRIGTDGLITLYAQEAPILDIVNDASKKLEKDYFIYSQIEGNTTTNLQRVSYDDLLANILNGTEYTYKTIDNLYMIGERQLEGLRRNKLVSLEHRSVIELAEQIPETLKENITITEFPDLNGFLLSGSAPRIAELEEFIKEIDKPVPVIQIEVIIVDNKKNYNISTGINAGLGDEPAVTGGTLYPTPNLTLSASSINDILNSFNGFGTANIGRVTPNFYMTLSAMEDQGIIKVRSTPKLSTLNGHEAEMKIGNTEYYKEEISNFNYNQSTQQTVTSRYQSVNADLTIKVTPIVSNDDQITLDINIEQSDFTSRISKEAPPGQVSRSFTSKIRVKNGEMILLGGLEEKSHNETSSGVPILSRIPLVKWLFSSRTKQDSKSRLNVFIKPLIIN